MPPQRALIVAVKPAQRRIGEKQERWLFTKEQFANLWVSLRDADHLKEDWNARRRAVWTVCPEVSDAFTSND